MSKIVKLGDLCDFINGGSWSDKEYVTNGIPVLKVSNFKPTGFLLEDVSKISYRSLEKYKKHLLQKGDMVIATVGSHPNLVNSAAGRSCVITDEVTGYLLNQNAVCVRTLDSEVLDQKYLTYLGKSYYFQHYIQSRGRGAANQMRIAISAIKEYEFDLPDIETQRSIADNLRTYDDLIENNQKQINLLEEATMRLYKEWFINLKFPGYETTKMADGVPEGWKYDEIGNLISNVPRAKQIKKTEYKNAGEIPVIDQSKEFIAGYTDDSEAIVNLGVPVIVFGDHTRILKLISFPFAKGADGTQLIVSSIEKIPQHLLYCSLLSVDLSNYHYARHYKYLKATRIIVPTKDIAEQFENKIEPYFKNIQILRDMIIRLEKGRDKLLPKLMSGEIGV